MIKFFLVSLRVLKLSALSSDLVIQDIDYGSVSLIYMGLAAGGAYFIISIVADVVTEDK